MVWVLCKQAVDMCSCMCMFMAYELAVSVLTMRFMAFVYQWGAAEVTGGGRGHAQQGQLIAFI